MSNNQDVYKKQFYSKLKTTKKINSRLINREDLKLIRRFLSNSEEESGKVSKSFKKRIRRNIFKIVNIGADSNVVSTLVASSSVTDEENSRRQISVSLYTYFLSFLTC